MPEPIPGAPPLPSQAELDTMFEAVEAGIARPPTPVERLRQGSTVLRSVSLLGVALAMLALILLGLRRVDLGVYPLPRLLGAGGALAAAVLGAGAVVLRPLHRRPVAGWLLGGIAGLAVVVPAIVCGLPAAHHGHPASLVGTGVDLVPRAAGCFGFGMAFAVGLVGVVWLLERSALRRRSVAVLALVGAGAFANLLLLLHCPVVAPIHNLAGHATISLVLMLVAVGVALRRGG